MTQRLPIQIDTEGSRVNVAGGIGLLDFRRLLATFHNLTSKAGYPEIDLDLTYCSAAYSGPMLAICADVIRLRNKGVRFRLTLPESAALANRFQNTGWANLIAPEDFAESTFRGYRHVPVIVFTDPFEQHSAVNRMMDAILASIDSVERDDLAAIEWSLNEVTDNVLVHSQAEAGGLVQLTNASMRRRVEFVVADAGVGIASTLRGAHAHLTTDALALERAIREGVTRDKSVGQGNGLFGSFQVAQASEGYFHIHSGNARLDFDNNDLRIRTDQIPYHGSMVVASMGFSNPLALASALQFQGKPHRALTFVDQKYERGESETLIFPIRNEASSYGSRVAGQPLRLKLKNLVTMNPGRRIVVSFEGVNLVSSSFADEVLGKLFVELGPTTFMRVIEVVDDTPTVRALVDRAILQRTQTGL